MGSSPDAEVLALLGQALNSSKFGGRLVLPKPICKEKLIIRFSFRTLASTAKDLCISSERYMECGLGVRAFCKSL